MTRRIVTCSRSSTLLDVEELMSNELVSRVVVADTNENPEGLISEKDVMRFILTDNSARELKEIHAHEVMSSRLFTIKPHSPISRAAEIMIRENISSLLVSGDQLEGIITKADVANYLGATKCRTHSVGQCMTPKPHYGKTITIGTLNNTVDVTEQDLQSCSCRSEPRTQGNHNPSRLHLAAAVLLLRTNSCH